MSPRLLGALALLAAAACGKSREEQLFDERKAICDRLVSGAATLRTASEELARSPFGGACPEPGKPFAPVPGDTCDYQNQNICFVRWEWLANDRSLCSPFGCVYGCEGRFEGEPGLPLVNDKTVCGTRFFKGQP